MKAYERRIERNKERILRATLELFQVHGIKKTTTNDIARKAGVSPATVYNHFDSKEDLTRATIKYFLTGVAADFRKIVEGDLPFLKKLEQVILYKSDMFGQYQGELLQTLITEDPEIRQLVESVSRVEITPYVIDFYEEGKRQGYINPELSTETIMLFSEITRKGMTAESSLSEDPEHNRKLLQELIPLYLYGIMGTPGPEEVLHEK
ncbi:TetR/AcrR family transcriptional regulator [Chloroflexota bacterium]